MTDHKSKFKACISLPSHYCDSPIRARFQHEEKKTRKRNIKRLSLKLGQTSRKRNSLPRWWVGHAALDSTRHSINEWSRSCWLKPKVLWFYPHDPTRTDGCWNSSCWQRRSVSRRDKKENKEEKKEMKKGQQNMVGKEGKEKSTRQESGVDGGRQPTRPNRPRKLPKRYF